MIYVLLSGVIGVENPIFRHFFDKKSAHALERIWWLVVALRNKTWQKRKVSLEATQPRTNFCEG